LAKGRIAGDQKREVMSFSPTFGYLEKAIFQSTPFVITTLLLANYHLHVIRFAVAYEVLLYHNRFTNARYLGIMSLTMPFQRSVQWSMVKK
jgi:hypothetical protein